MENIKTMSENETGNLDTNRTGDWMQTFLGGMFWPLDPRTEEIFIEDIAHSLSLQCRFAGHSLKFYSVGEHSIRVSNILPKSLALWGLMHDSAEAYLVDLPRPIKRCSEMGDVYSKAENVLLAAICKRFSLPLEEPPEVKMADGFLLRWEQRDLMAPPPAPWRGMDNKTLPESTIVPLAPKETEMLFLRRFRELYGK